MKNNNNNNNKKINAMGGGRLEINHVNFINWEEGAFRLLLLMIVTFTQYNMLCVYNIFLVCSFRTETEHLFLVILFSA